MAFQGIDIRQSGDRIVFRVSLKDSALAILATGTTSLRLYELQNDGTLKSYDFNDNTFKTTALTTETQALTHRAGNNGGTNTGLWTYALTTLTGFTAGNVYFAQVVNTGASPPEQEREFQFGGGQGANVTQLDGSTQAAANLKNSSLAIVSGTVATDGSNSATSFKVDATLGAKAENYFGNSDGGMVLVFIDGTTNEWQSKRVVAFNTTTDFITVEEAFDSTPSDDDTFILVGRITELS